MSNFKEWKFTITESFDGGMSAECNSYIDTDGNTHHSHNEISFLFNIDKNNKIHILCGSHIGTQDFDWYENSNIDGVEIINHYHKGLLEQIAKELSLC